MWRMSDLETLLVAGRKKVWIGHVIIGVKSGTFSDFKSWRVVYINGDDACR
jgi:NADPH-dependent 7-cyano-7-deazaguanine reductase QueF-like protein